jgi:glycine oxidase
VQSVAIVGAGIIGCAIARALAARGVACTVFDDRPVGGGATRASAGMLAPYVEAHERGPLLDLCVRSLDLYDAWIDDVRRESEVDVEYRRIGTLEIAFDDDHAAEFRRRAHGEPRIVRTWLDAAAARREHPALAPIAGALFTPAHGYVSAPNLASALAAAAKRHGADFRRSAVQAIAPHGSSLRVTTAVGVIDAGSVVLAAGAWTNRIAGIVTPPLRPVRGQLLQLGWHGHPISTILWGPDCYVVPRTDGSLLVGATVEDVGFDERTTTAGIRALRDAASRLLPESSAATLLDARAGLRPAAADDLPVVGPDADLPGLVHAAGHYRNGVLLAPITAALIADWIVEGKRDPAFDQFRSDRFAQ